MVTTQLSKLYGVVYNKNIKSKLLSVEYLTDRVYIIGNSMNTKKKSRSEIKRDAILCAAKQAFQEFGVQNTSMDKLSEMAQVSKRTVYNHFVSKEAIVTELLTELWRNSTTETNIENLSKLPIDQQLIELLFQEIMVMTAPSYIELAKVAFGHFFYKPEELKQQTERIAKQETALSRWLVEQCDNKRLVIEDIDMASMQLHNLVKGSAFWPQLVGIKASLSKAEAKRLATQSSALFLSHYLVQPSS